MIKFQDFKKDKKTSGDREIDCVRKMNGLKTRIFR